MEYNILYSALSRKDLNDIFDHIAYVLLEPSVAAAVVRRIEKAVRGLEYMPEKFRVYKVLSGCEVREVSESNYSIFYSIDKSDMTVRIHRIIYSGRDMDNQKI